MEILVVNGYVRENKGDAALMSVLCKELQYTFKDSAIKISSQEDPVKRPVFESWENIGSFTQYVSEPSIGKARRLIRILVTLTMPLFLLINKGGGVVSLYKNNFSITARAISSYRWEEDILTVILLYWQL
jgi:polysaccharide pyruvyl transferase WcaK-like protein